MEILLAVNFPGILKHDMFKLSLWKQAMNIWITEWLCSVVVSSCRFTLYLSINELGNLGNVFKDIHHVIAILNNFYSFIIPNHYKLTAKITTNWTTKDQKLNTMT